LRFFFGLILLGQAVGGAYDLLNQFSSFIQRFSAPLYSRLRVRPLASTATGTSATATTVNKVEVADGAEEKRNSFRLDRKTAMTGLRKSVPALRKTILAMVVVMVLMRLLMGHDAIDDLAASFGSPLWGLGLLGDCIAPLAMYFVHFLEGYALVAVLMQAGAITSKQAVITLLVGSKVATTMI
jgi:hypothetical protein